MRRSPFLVLALVIGLPGGLIMALPPQVLRRENLATGMGIYYAGYYAAMALLLTPRVRSATSP